MKRFFLLLSLFTICLIPAISHSNDDKSVTLIPLKINSLEDQSNLNDQITDILMKELKKLKINLNIADNDISIPALKSISKYKESQFVLWGSLNVLGNVYSVDLKFLDLNQIIPDSIYEEGESLISLAIKIKKIAKQISMIVYKQEQISDIVIKGNKRIEKNAILRVIQSKPGDIYIEPAISNNLKNIYLMGYFDAVEIKTEKSSQGQSVIITVQEKPTVRRLILKGNKVIKDEKILENINIAAGSILNIINLKKDIIKIEELYKDDNYQNISISYEIKEIDNKYADIIMTLDEGSKVKIKNIEFDGNEAFSDRKLRKEISLKKKSAFSWITSSGELKKEGLEQDPILLSQFYQKKGYADVKISEPDVEMIDGEIYIKYKIKEGPLYTIGSIDVEGDLEFSKKDILKKVKTKIDKEFNGEDIYKDIISISDMYSDIGYASAFIKPKTIVREGTTIFDLVFVINKGKKIYINNIYITGNYKTRDKVIRREMPLKEQEVFSGVKFKQGMTKLRRLDYFDDINLDQVVLESEDKMDIKIDVSEKRTSMFSLGGGYSSEDLFTGIVSVTEKNLFGRGLKLGAEANVGKEVQNYSISFSDPWLFDVPLSFGFKLYRNKKTYGDIINYKNYDYDKTVLGGSITLGYEVYDYTHVFLTYSNEDVDLEYDNHDDDPFVDYYDKEGDYLKNSIRLTGVYDNRDNIVNTHKGFNHRYSIEHSGLGGSISFNKYRGQSSWYIPIIDNFTGMFGVKGAYLDEIDDVPNTERFYLGGVSTLRGYKYRKINNGNISEEILGTTFSKEVGGNAMMQFNAELKVPIFAEKGIFGVIFCDSGMVWDGPGDLESSFSFDRLRSTAGGGIRWYSPIGPLSLDYGTIIDDIGDTGEGRWEFSMGGTFF